MRATIAAILMSLALGDGCPADQLAQFAVVGDVIPRSLTGVPGDAARGRSIVLNRAVGLCLLCHSGPFPEERFQGNLAPDLKGTGARWSVEQLRMRSEHGALEHEQQSMASSRLASGHRPH